MPWVTVSMVSGHGPDKKKALHKNVARAVYETLGIPEDWVKVQIVEMADEDHSIGGVQICDLPE
ncbi:MAG: tautomerase family protein [Alphaproteobacteria bacterium]|nr:tautomerase family protein [Alphaproteobacteria bacterium]